MNLHEYIAHQERILRAQTRILNRRAQTRILNRTTALLILATALVVVVMIVKVAGWAAG